MDPRFIFNHARPGPIRLVYSAAERTGLGGDHYLDTRLTNEAGPPPRPLRLPLPERGPGFSSFVPHSRHPAKAPSDCQRAQCVGHGNKHTHHTSFLPVHPGPCAGTLTAPPSPAGLGRGGSRKGGGRWRLGRPWQRRSGQGNGGQGERKKKRRRPAFPGAPSLGRPSGCWQGEGRLSCEHTPLAPSRAVPRGPALLD